MENYNDLYKGKCITCAKYRLTKNWHDIHSGIGFECSKHGWQDPYDSCGSYSYTYRSDSVIDSCLKEFLAKRKYYIVTVCSKILGLDANNKYIEAFKDITENVLNTPYGDNLLIDYDFYGVAVSDIILYEYLDEKTKDSTLKMINEYIIPEFDKMIEAYNKGAFDSVIRRYILLTRRLMQKYNISYPDENIAIKSETTAEEINKDSVYTLVKKK